MKKKLILLSSLVLGFAPVVAFAAPVLSVCDFGNGTPKLQQLLSYGTCIISNSIIPLIFVLAVVVFVWGVVQYVMNADSDESREKGRQFMIWGIIGITVMLSVWGLVKILGGTFGIEYVIPRVKP